MQYFAAPGGMTVDDGKALFSDLVSLELVDSTSTSPGTIAAGSVLDSPSLSHLAGRELLAAYQTLRC